MLALLDHDLLDFVHHGRQLRIDRMRPLNRRVLDALFNLPQLLIDVLLTGLGHSQQRGMGGNDLINIVHALLDPFYRVIALLIAPLKPGHRGPHARPDTDDGQREPISDVQLSQITQPHPINGPVSLRRLECCLGTAAPQRE